MQKILEIKGQDWMKALSVQTGIALGGLFQTYSGTDPYERIGFLQPSLSSTELTAPATNPIKVITEWQSGGDQKLYAHTTSKLYQYLRNSPYTQTDVTAEIDVADAFGGVTGAIVYKDKYVYSQPTDMFANALPVASASNVQILNGSSSQLLDIRKFCIGADKYLYCGDFAQVNQITSTTGTSGNTAAGFLIDSQHVVRDLLNDGRYLVVFADNNAIATTSRLVGNYSCRIYFWDYVKATADVIWELPGESYIIGAQKLGSSIVVFGYSGIWLCNSVTEPYQIASFLGNSTLAGTRPLNPYQITASPTSVYWGQGSVNGQKVYAYGSLPGSNERRFYTPYITHGSTYAHTSLSYSAGNLFAAVDSPKFYIHNAGSTRGTASAQNAPIQLPQPFRYGYAKVVLREKLTSGQSVTLGASTASGVVISDNVTKSYSAANARKNLKFDLKPLAGSTSIFEDIYLTISTEGATVERVAVYGKPLDDATQEL